MPPSDTTAAAASSIRVFLLIENRLLREALFRLFRKHSDILVVGQGGQAELNPQSVLDGQYDVLIIDSAEVKWLVASVAVESMGQTACKTILIGMESDEEQFIAAVRSGVTGYLLQDACSSDVVAAVRAVFSGEAVCPPQLYSSLFRFVAQRAREIPLQISTSRPDLTLRQQQLVTLVAKGLTNKEIASHLNLSEFTVRNHIHRILKQVDAGSRSEAVEAIRAYGYLISP
jgi:two-component system, NarL family, nitrate/nitrite response regulator NarL